MTGQLFSSSVSLQVSGPGLIILIPFFEKMTKVRLRVVTMDIPSQKIITKDNVSIDIAAVAYYKIVRLQKSRPCH